MLENHRENEGVAWWVWENNNILRHSSQMDCCIGKGRLYMWRKALWNRRGKQKFYRAKTE